MRVFSYARYSTEHQNEQTITDQLRRCREFAQARGWPAPIEHTDEGISGAALGNRPGVQAILREVAPRDVVLVVDTTRLSRSQDLAPLLTRLRHRGVRVLGLLDGFDSDSRTARMQAGLSGIMSEEFRSSIASRTHSALDMRAREGRATGGKCYGFASDGAVIDEQAAIVREVFARAAAGESQRAIAEDLNRRGVPAPGASWARKKRRADGVWLVSALHAMLANERYTGRAVWNRSVWRRDPDSGKRQRVMRPESEWIVTEGPRIIDAETWDRVRRLATPRKLHGGGRGPGPRYLLSGLLVCAECGSKLIVSGHQGSRYYCATRRYGGPSACSNAGSASRQVAEQRILEPIRAQLLAPDAVRVAVETIGKLARDSRRQAAQPADVADLDARIGRLQAAVEAGTLDREDVAPALAALHKRRTDALARAWRQAGEQAALDVSAAQARYAEAVADMAARLAGHAAQARDALHALLGDVVCAQDGRGMVAQVRLDPAPLVAQIGSGGTVLNYAPWLYTVALR